jgi:hypothetical protein
MSKYTRAVERNLSGLHAVSTGACPGCAECADVDPDVGDEGGFSWSGCGICGSSLGGTLYRWHALTPDNELLHFDDCCQDCVFFLANGDEPEPAIEEED